MSYSTSTQPALPGCTPAKARTNKRRPGAPLPRKAYPLAPLYSVRLVKEARGTKTDVDSCEDAAGIFKPFFEGRDREQMMVMMLDAKNRLIGVNLAHVGTLTSSLAGAREIIKPAILANACSIILAHNHPSGDPRPSPEDIRVTDHLTKACAIFDIALLDHIIMADTGYLSMSKMDLMGSAA